MSGFKNASMKVTADEGLSTAAAETLTEAELREQLAAAYQLTHMLGMDYMIYNHITVRVPGPEKHFLINPFGLTFEEVTAENLVKIDLHGNIIGDAKGRSINYAGFIIHGAIHEASPNLHCVMHTHTEAGVSLACMETELLPISQDALMFYDRIGYHEYEGIVSDPAERQRMLAAMGDKPVLVLRNHGLLTAAPSVAGAFIMMVFLEKACRTQLSVLSSGQRVKLTSEEVSKHTAQQYWSGSCPPESFGQQAFAALRRRLDRNKSSKTG